ncbi:hypothetical protein C1645_850292 [Glomus cerebriforme]|uniref:Uncharacterized protein n=1 Tax=Glomus cerebriforme TaxID=658196 RepID=A0A397SUQ7_9GLOM|nr:hypothetical protein C1645_850292 [Glomus cerebriforme]
MSTVTDFKQRYAELKERVKVLRSLERKFANSYEIMEETLEITTSYIEQLKYNIEVLGRKVDHLEHLMNGVKFLSTYRDWVNIFIQEITERLDRNWELITNSLDRRNKEIPLTTRQINCIKELENLLESIRMTTCDIELLRNVKDQSNIQFHSDKNLKLDQAAGSLRKEQLIPLQKDRDKD